MILVVYNLICFHEFVFTARAAKQLPLAERSAVVRCERALEPHDKNPTNRVEEDHRWNMRCTVLY